MNARSSATPTLERRVLSFCRSIFTLTLSLRGRGKGEGVVIGLVLLLLSDFACGSGKPVKNPHRLSLSGFFLHAFLRRAGEGHLQKVQHRIGIHSDGYHDSAPGRGRR